MVSNSVQLDPQAGGIDYWTAEASGILEVRGRGLIGTILDGPAIQNSSPSGAQNKFMLASRRSRLRPAFKSPFSFGSMCELYGHGHLGCAQM
jgi:hypothetical protein